MLGLVSKTIVADPSVRRLYPCGLLGRCNPICTDVVFAFAPNKPPRMIRSLFVSSVVMLHVDPAGSPSKTVHGPLLSPAGKLKMYVRRLLGSDTKTVALHVDSSEYQMSG